jgi:hypothetical protein
MVNSTHSSYPPELADKLADYLFDLLKDFCFSNGLLQKPPTTDPNATTIEGAIPAPVTVFPSLMPLSCVEEAKSIQTFYNRLYAGISKDEDWLKPIIEE